MELTTVLYGLILGIFLTIGDGVSTQNRMRFGYKRGLLTWVVTVAVPLAVAIAFAWQIALVAAITGTVFSGLMFWQARTNRGFKFGAD